MLQAKGKSRSFVECCTKCDVSKGCRAAAYRDGECNILDETAIASFVPGNGTKEDFKVMIFNAQDKQQVRIYDVNNLLLICHQHESGESQCFVLLCIIKFV